MILNKYVFGNIIQIFYKQVCCVRVTFVSNSSTQYRSSLRELSYECG